MDISIGVRKGIVSVLRTIYPPHCLSCNEVVGTDGGLCGSCWRDTPFVTGLVCDQCGVPLAGDQSASPVQCDDCLSIARPWTRGRAAMVYRDNARRIVMRFKHGDRTEMAPALAEWLAAAGQEIIEPGQLVVPVPLHWMRLFTRRYNQAALLTDALSRRMALQTCPDLLQRPRSTGSQDGRNRDQRFENLANAVRVNPRRAALLPGRHVLLVDDVMTTGATFAACADTMLAAGAAEVRVLALARVSKDV